MIRKFTAVTLFVSYIAMSSSGLVMFFIAKPSFTIQMHPVHKLFGLVMILAVIVHLSFNVRVLASYLKKESCRRIQWTADSGFDAVVLSGDK